FLGRPASCHKALALFALLNHAPLLVVTCIRAGRPLRFTMKMDAMVEPHNNQAEFSSVENLTQWYNDELATQIRLQPDQYWWLHNRWREVSAKKLRKKNPPLSAEADQIRRPAA